MNPFKTLIFIIFICLFTASCSPPEPEKSTQKTIINVSGSAAVVPLFELLRSEFSRIAPDIELRLLPYAHSKAGMEGVFIGDYDLGLISRELTDEERKYGLRYIHLAEDLLVFATGRNIKIDNLTTNQIRAIYSGRIKNWKEVGGPDEKIAVLDRPEHVSPKKAMRKLLFGKNFKITPDAIVLERPDDMDQALVTIPNAIGYTSLGNSLLKGYSFNIIKINNIQPTLSNLQNRTYPYSRPFAIVLKPKPEKKVMRFVEFIFSNEALQIIERSGFSPIKFSLIIGILPEQDLIRQQLRYQALADYLAKELGLGVNVSIKLLPNYRELVRELKNGQITAAFFGSLIYVLAKKELPLVPVARPEKNGVSMYRGLIFVRKDSNIRSPSEMKGKTLALVDKATTAGYLYPVLYFRNNGIWDLNKYFKKVIFTGSHDLAFLKVHRGEADVGGAKDLVFYRLDPSVQKDIKILAASPPVPENGLAINANVRFTCYECHVRTKNAKSGIKHLNIEESLRDIFLNLDKTEEGREILKSLGADRFIINRDEDYMNVIYMLKESGMKIEEFIR